MQHSLKNGLIVLLVLVIVALLAIMFLEAAVRQDMARQLEERADKAAELNSAPQAFVPKDELSPQQLALPDVDFLYYDSLEVTEYPTQLSVELRNPLE